CCLTELLFLDPAQAQRIGSLSRAYSRERDCRSSSQDWPQIDLHFIDQPLVERLTKNFAATFDQYAGDAAFTQILQHRRQRFSFIDQSLGSKFVGHDASLAWQLARACQHNAPRLTRPVHAPNS